MFTKNVAEEFSDTYKKVRQFFTSKLEKNLKRVCEKTQMGKMGAENFESMQFFMLTLAENLKTHTGMDIINFVSILEEQQKKFTLDFKTKKTEELKLLLDNELWNHS